MDASHVYRVHPEQFMRNLLGIHNSSGAKYATNIYISILSCPSIHSFGGQTMDLHSESHRPPLDNLMFVIYIKCIIIDYSLIWLILIRQYSLQQQAMYFVMRLQVWDDCKECIGPDIFNQHLFFASLDFPHLWPFICI